jgi:RNA polymerase sigma factor (sigma-70 family)
MNLNQGLQKYRQTAKTNSKKEKELAEKKAAAEKEAAAAGAKKNASSAKAAGPAKTASAKATAASKTPAKAAVSSAKSGPKGKNAKHAEEFEEAAKAAQAAEEAAKEEEQLQKEIAEELARDAQTTSTLVKEDFSPTNATRDKLITEYAPLIKYIAQKIAARLPANIELDDLISSGVIGLMDAIDKYDASRDNKFKTYAEFRIRGAILDELRAQDWVPRSVREKAKQLERCYARIEQAKGRQATDEEVCADLNISQE